MSWLFAYLASWLGPVVQLAAVVGSLLAFAATLTLAWFIFRDAAARPRLAFGAPAWAFGLLTFVMPPAGAIVYWLLHLSPWANLELYGKAWEPPAPPPGTKQVPS